MLPAHVPQQTVWTVIVNTTCGHVCEITSSFIALGVYLLIQGVACATVTHIRHGIDSLPDMRLLHEASAMDGTSPATGVELKYGVISAWFYTLGCCLHSAIAIMHFLVGVSLSNQHVITYKRS